MVRHCLDTPSATTSYNRPTVSKGSDIHPWQLNLTADVKVSIRTVSGGFPATGSAVQAELACVAAVCQDFAHREEYGFMKHYKVFENQAGRWEAVKVGWSWPAACFSFIWAFSKKLYAVGAVLVAAGVLLGFLSLKVDELFAMGDSNARSADHLCHLAQWVLIVILGVNGNELREKDLLARGYELRGILAAPTPREALTRCRAEPSAQGQQAG